MKKKSMFKTKKNNKQTNKKRGRAIRGIT